MTQLSFGQRWRLSWELAWPVAVMDLVITFVIHALLNVEGESLDSLWAIGVFLIVSPWAIRRAFSLSYEGARIGVARTNGRSGALTYEESLKVMWLLAWRSLILVLVAILVFSALLRVAGLSSKNFAVESKLGNAIGLSLIDSVISLGCTPVLIPGMLRKKYRGFRLVVQ